MSHSANPPIQRLLTTSSTTPIEPAFFTISGRVISKKNSKRIAFNRRTGRPLLVSSHSYKDFSEEATAELTEQLYKAKARGFRFPLQAPYSLDFTFLLKGVSSTDIDNMITSVCDVLQDAGIIDDDKNVVSISARKHNGQPEYKTAITIYQHTV